MDIYGHTPSKIDNKGILGQSYQNYLHNLREFFKRNLFVVIYEIIVSGRMQTTYAKF